MTIVSALTLETSNSERVAPWLCDSISVWGFSLAQQCSAIDTETRKPLETGARNEILLAPSSPGSVHWLSGEAVNTMVPQTNVMFSDSREQKDCRQQWRLTCGCARRIRCALMPLLSRWSALGVQRKSICSYSMPPHCQLLAWHAYGGAVSVLWRCISNSHYIW